MFTFQLSLQGAQLLQQPISDRGKLRTRVRNFDDAEKRRNVPATRNPLCLWLFGGEPFKVLYCVHIATNSEHWLDAFHLRNKPQE